MNKIIYPLMVCALSIVVASCGGRSTDADRIAQLEDSIAKLNSPKYEEKATDSKEEVRTVATEENAPTEIEVRNVSGATSRNDFPSILSGTTWIGDGGTLNSLRKYVFSGNTLNVYDIEGRRDNFDDPIIWSNNPTLTLSFYLVQEPQKGHYKLQYRKDASGTTGLINFEFNENNAYEVQYDRSKYSGGSHIPLKKM